MTSSKTALRVLVVDDNRDGADSLGLLLEQLGNKVHVTYGGSNALEVANVFQPDLMLIDLLMPEMDGCELVKRLRQIPALVKTNIVAITGQKSKDSKTSAIDAGFDMVVLKPVDLAGIKAVLASVDIGDTSISPKPILQRSTQHTKHRLPIDEARRIRNQRPSKALTLTESQAAICDGIVRFQEEYLGWRSELIQAHFVKDLIVVRIHGVLTQAERQLTKTQYTQGKQLIKQVRKQLLELARPMLDSLVHEVVGVKAVSMHHDISTVTGEELVVFSLEEVPLFG